MLFFFSFFVLVLGRGGIACLCSMSCIRGKMEVFHTMKDKMERGMRTIPTSSSPSNRTQKKREHISALQKRDLREKLEREIKNVIAKPSDERTKEEAKLLDAHKEKVSSLLKQMEKSLHRKRLLEEKAEEKEDSKQEIADGVAVVMKLLREDAGLQFVLHTGAGISTSAKIFQTLEAQEAASGRSKGKASRCPCQSLKTRNRRRHTWRVKRCTTRRFVRRKS